MSKKIIEGKSSSRSSLRYFQKKEKQFVTEVRPLRKKTGSHKRVTKDKVSEKTTRQPQLDLLLTEETGILEAEGIEKTFKFKQHQILKNVDLASAGKRFTLQLEHHGPYLLDYYRNGRFLLMGGKKGHIAALDWYNKKLITEFQVQEEIKDLKWLHTDVMFAVAQKKFLYIYDNNGLEIHRLKDQHHTIKLEFLPYHFLLVTVSRDGILGYRDISTGQIIASHRAKQGSCKCMCQNRRNAIINLGHQDGTVTLWKPAMPEPIVKMLCHRTAVSAIGVDNDGRYLVTCSLEGQMKIWDIRTYRSLQTYYNPTPAACLSISQTGLLAVGFGPNVQVWKDVFTSKQSAPYMAEVLYSKEIENLAFCPYEDVLGIGHSTGFDSFIVPGAGEPNFDALECNPYQSKKQRQESEVKHLLDKIQPELITVDPHYLTDLNRSASDKFDFEGLNANYKTRKRSLTNVRLLKKRAGESQLPKLKEPTVKKTRPVKHLLEDTDSYCALGRFINK